MPRKTVAIRGLDTELYHEVFTMAKKDGKRVAEVVNNALEEFLNGDLVKKREALNGNGKGVFTLRNDGEITLSKKDILSMKKEVGPFRIETSGRLILEKDLDSKTLGNIDRIIINDGVVEVPRDLYPQILMRSDIFGKIEKY
ncbi:MAG: hypothetical protein JSV27_01800 [Candidatus Bathyarchaeota archaeon]|nr:MAG: hypothetical protein JSV27_01800 [Candidatus Bathyarchaeota archaeon]